MFKITPTILKNIESICIKMYTDNNNKINNLFMVHSTINVPIIYYINRIIKYFNCSDSFIILALIYINRLHQLNIGIKVNKYSIHRLIFTACVISCKFLEDDHFDNGFYADVAGISLEELNILEIEMLKKLDYNLYVKDSEYDEYINKLQQEIT